MELPAPLIEKTETDLMASDLLHAEDTPIRVLDRQAATGGWARVRKGPDLGYDRDHHVQASPPGAVYAFAPDWKEEHIHRHLVRTRGILHAYGYNDYTKLNDPDPDGTIAARVQ